jgi:hypothetical protein
VPGRERERQRQRDREREGEEGGREGEAEQAFPGVPALTQILTLGKSFNLFMSVALICKVS